MPQPRYISRLAKKQRAHNLRLTIIMSLLTAGVLALLVFAGLPLFVRLAGWWADIQSADSQIQSEDTTPPTPPRLRLAANITNKQTIDVSGFAEPNSSLKLYLNEQLVKEVVSESNGQFLATQFQLNSGPNTIFALALDQAGNQSQPSNSEIVILDTQLPLLKIQQPQSGNEFKGPGQRRVEVIGDTEPEARLWVNQRLAQVDSKGRFVHSLTLSEGEQTVEIKAIDEAGNETTELIPITYQP